jgi:hypothetical protein
MRRILCAIAGIVVLTGSSAAVPAAERETQAPPTQRCVVFCRRVTTDDHYFSSQIHTLGAGETISAWQGLDVAIKKIKPSDGATVEVTLAPEAGERGAHVVKFVKFDDTLVIPLCSKAGGSAATRIEVLIGGGDVVHWNWTWNDDSLRSPEDAERERVFRTVGATGTARISCSRGSRLKEVMGDEAYDSLWDGINGAQDYAEQLTEVYFIYCPRRPGMIDALIGSYVFFNEWLRMPSLTECEQMMFGAVPQYRVELIDGPWLLQNLQTLRRLPQRSRLAVTIYSKKPDQRVLKAAQDLRVATFGDPNVTYFWDTCEEHAEKGKSRDEYVKTVTVSWPLAEAAIPSFKNLPNLEEILILADSQQEGNARTTEMLRTVQKAFPKSEAHLVFYGPKKQTKNKAVEAARKIHESRST